MGFAAAIMVSGGSGASEPVRFHPALSSFEYRDGSKARTHWAATRTDSGRIIASGSGLVEFDGGSWRQLTTEGNFEWESLSADDSGRVWAGAADEIGVFEPAESGSLHYRSLTSLLPEAERDLGNVWHAFAKDGGTFFVCREQVVWTDGMRARSWRVPSSRRLFAWEDGDEVCVGDKEGGVLRLTPAGPERFGEFMAPSKFGTTWTERIGTADWLAKGDQGLISPSPARMEALHEVNRLLAGSAPVSYMRTADGRLAIGTYYRGLLLIDTNSGRFEQLDDKSGLPSHSVTGLLPGGRDWLWAVTTGGLSRVSLNGAVMAMRSEEGLDASSIRFVERQGDSVIIATNAGRFVLAGEGASGTLTKISNSWFGVSARSGGMLLSGGMTGLYGLTPEMAERLIEEAKDVISIVPDPRDPEWVYYATGKSIRAARWHEGSLRVVASVGMKRQIDSMVAGAGGTLWVANGRTVTKVVFDTGLVEFSPREEFAFEESAGSGGGETRLLRIGGSTVALLSGAIAELKEAEGKVALIEQFRDVEFLSVATSGDGVAWALARPSGHRDAPPRIVRIQHEGGSLKAEEMHVPGLLSMGSPSGIQVVRNNPGGDELWVGARDGIVRVDPVQLVPASPPPAVKVHMVRSLQDGQEAVSPGYASLPFKTGSIVFRWSAPDFVPGDLLVETRLAGPETGWLPSDAGRAREFTLLADGSYEFQVRTLDALGRPGPVASLAFTVLPPWYRTPGAILGFGLVVLVIGTVSWQLRMRAARRQAEELEALVETRTRELARVNAEMTRFIARMNHEIRNPLNGLLGAVAVLEQFNHAGREGRMIEILRACADHLGAVVEDVLDFSNIKGGRITVMDRAFSVAAMVESVPRMMLAESERTGTEVVTTISPGVPGVVVADPDKIRQILVNFLGNALKFAPGEPVQIEVATTTVDDAPWLRFAVRDHGPGISEADKKNLFTMFERGRSPQRRRLRGMGIGLATCRLLARRMGGEVGVISGLGEGSEFFLKLPLKVDTTMATGPDAGACTELHKLACLLVEDQEFNRIILKDMLERAGCSVDEAADAESALSLAARNHYDVVFTDLELPDAAPGEILNMLRKQQAAVRTTVPALVVTTAYATENVRRTCLGAGATAFLAKPLSAPKVLAVLREIDAARRPAASVEVPASKPAEETPYGIICHLARIRGKSVESVAREIGVGIEDEAARLTAAAGRSELRDVAQHAHRLLSLSALADTPGLAEVAAGIQSSAREGRLPSATALAALAAAISAAKIRLGSFSSAGPADAQSRDQGRSAPTASSHSD